MAKGEFGRLPRPPWTCRNAPFVEASLNWRTLDPSNPGGCGRPGEGSNPRVDTDPTLRSDLENLLESTGV